MTGVTFTVHGPSRAECMTALTAACTRLDLQPTLLPRQMTDSRWLARAAPRGASPVGRTADTSTPR